MYKNILIILFTIIFFNGCSSKQMSDSWKRTKTASYTAATDPITWGTALGATILYATPMDNKITKHFMEEGYFLSTNKDDFMREVNGAIAITTATFVPDDGNYTKKIKRLIVEGSTLILARETVPVLYKNISKENPAKTHNNAVGSHHALEPFTGAALTRRNVKQMNIDNWVKYTIVGSNYFLASLTSLIRVQEGGHSFGDQLVSASIGNYIGLFMHDVFMMENNANLNIAISRNSLMAGINYRF